MSSAQRQLAPSVKTNRVIGCTFLVLLCVFCSGIDNFDVVAAGETTVPQRSVLDEVIGQVSFLGFEGFDIASSQEFQNQGYTKDQIDSVRLSRFALTINSPADADFDFISSIRFFVEAEGLPRVEIAQLSPVPMGVSLLELEILDVELADYVAAESMTITTEATGMRPPQETTVGAEATFNIDVDVDGSLGCQVHRVTAAHGG